MTDLATRTATPLASGSDPARERDRLLARYAAARARTESLAAPLSAEDQQLQSMPDASPTKWHRAHTTWFFETFLLAPAGIDVVDSRYAYVFNSYYEAIGPRHPRSKRGLLSRPSAAEVSDYRRIVDEGVTRLLSSADGDRLAQALPIVELGIAHEEQHQELLLTDILHAFSENPLRPAYRPEATPSGCSPQPDPMRFVSRAGGLLEVGAPATRGGFAFDNERPRHKRWIEPFALADRLVSVRELKAFIDAGGYRTPSLWLSDGFDVVRARGLASPMHSSYEDGCLTVFTLAGARVARDDEPAVHVNYFEADAIARFLGARLPTEAEWETFAEGEAVRGNFSDGALRPQPASRAPDSVSGVRQLFGDAWEWTQSSYEPYPGYEVSSGALGEYNGKFMVSQMVLRGGSCLTPPGHVRASYRNFWHPGTQFQMAGVRLARRVPG
jgi:ergothioneine biosynthesis protein EgtB